MSNVREMFSKRIEDQQKTLEQERPGFDGGGGGGYDGDMNARITALETRLDTVLPTLATKSDIESVKTEIHKSTGDTHKWMIGTVIGLFLGFGGLFLAMSNALKPAPFPQAAPTIIQVPVPAPAPPATAK